MCKLRNNILVTVGQETGRLFSGAGTKTQGNKASTTGTFFSDSIVDFLKIHGLLQTRGHERQTNVKKLPVTKTALTILSEKYSKMFTGEGRNNLKEEESTNEQTIDTVDRFFIN